MASTFGGHARTVTLGIFIFMLRLDNANARDVFFLARRDRLMTPITDLLQELEKVTSQNHRLATERRVGRLEDALRPMYAALPKDVNGTLGSPGVRYLLHRLFVQRHGWFVKGLDHGGDAWNTSSPAAVFKEHAEEHHDLFDGELRNHGFTLTQVAVFGAALETLVHADSKERLQAAYDIMGLSPASVALQENETLAVMRAYMIMYTFAVNHSALDREQFDFLARQVVAYYPTFNDTETFVNEVREHVLEDSPASERNSMNTSLRVLEEVGERYGRWQDKECRALKKLLVNMESVRAGRVRLQDFYGSALTKDNWQFMEGEVYLKEIGALDDSDPQQMSVIIPNYLNSPTNCVSGSKFFSVCCIDECETLLATLENHIAAPEATSARILAHVAAIPSDTVEAPRILPITLVERLKEIEAYHGGRVPLHGRLFAQWMHHAYPRECIYPHITGTTRPVTPVEWMRVNPEGQISVTMDEVRLMLDQPSNSTAEINEDLPWLVEEELFIYRSEWQEPQSRSVISKTVMLIATVFSLLLLLLRLHSSLGRKSTAGHNYFV